jgi:Prenyltransferase and squalene oxidase repeat
VTQDGNGPRSILRQAAEKLTPPTIDEAFRYLRETRNPRQGWGLLRGLPTEIYPSALAVEALMGIGDSDAEILAEDVTAYFRRRVAGEVDRLGMDDLASLLVILHSEPGNDDEDRERIAERLKQGVTTISGSRTPIRIARACWILRPLLRYGSLADTERYVWVDWLIARQEGDGGWPSISGERSSVVTTALALRTLSNGDRERSADQLARGRRYLRQIVEENGWSSLSPAGDTYTVAVVLSALARDNDGNYGSVADGIARLRGAANADGGWGAGPGEPSNVEVTALAVEALVAAGNTSFVPLRLAETAVADLQEDVRAARAESEARSGDIQRAVDAQCGELLKERDALKAETRELKAGAQRARELQRSLQRELQRAQIQFAPDYAVARLEFPTRLTGIVLTIGLIGGSIPLILQARGGSMLFYVAIAILVTGFAGGAGFELRARLVARNRLALYQELAVADRSTVALLRQRFISIAERLPPSLLEEVIYSLYGDFADAPPDIAERFAQRLSLQLGLPAGEAEEFREWATLLAQFSPRERRAVLESLRRTVLA